MFRIARFEGAFAGLALASLLAATGPSAALGQDQALPPADPADVSSVDAIIAATYDVISGPAGQARNWDRFRSLFIPEARLIAAGRNPQGQVGYRATTPGEYVERTGSFLVENGFFEREIGRVTEEFGHVIHVFSTYDSKRTPEDAEPFARGINSFQLFHDGNRYWVVTIFWNAERPDLPIPARYLGARGR